MNSVLKIWVVEDDPTYQEMLISFLSIIGFHAQGFSSGEECLKHLDENPDVVILDHNLGPGIHGLDVLRNIKSLNEEISVIYVSGEEKLSVVSDVYKNGSEYFIEKDNASLLRLKLQLEKIAIVKALKARKTRKKKIKLVVGITIIIALSTLLLAWFGIAV